MVISPKKPVDLFAQTSVVREDHFLRTIQRKHGIVRIEGSRGCSWNRCSFCCVNAKYANPSWRPFPITKIISELRELSSYGFVSPYFTDEDFFGQDYQRSIEIASKIIELKQLGEINPQMDFFISILAADATNPSGQRALSVWKDAGLREVFLGIESFEQNQLKRFCKKANADINQKAIEFVKSIGLQIDSGYILFDPQISFEALGININYIQSLQLNKLDSRSLKRLRLQPMTTISDDMSESIIGKLDIDSLEYPYTFHDRQVENVYKAFKQWENANLYQVWRIQAASRGEVDEAIRVQLKSILGQIRDIDFSVLKLIYENCTKKESQSIDVPVLIKQQKQRCISTALQLINVYFPENEN